MDIESIRPMVDEIAAEFGIRGRQIHVDSANGVPDSEAVQVKILDASLETKTVTIDVHGGGDGQTLGGDELRQRLKEHLATFQEPPLR